MLYDGIAAESAHVSIDGRATASIIDEKKLPEWAASEAVFCQVSQLGEAGAGHARTQWHASAQHLAASQNGVWWWVITHHQSFKFQPDFDEHGIRIRSFLRMAQAGATGCTITWPGCWTFGPRNGREQPVENGESTSSGDGQRVAVRVPEKSLHFVLLRCDPEVCWERACSEKVAVGFRLAHVNARDR